LSTRGLNAEKKSSFATGKSNPIDPSNGKNCMKLYAQHGFGDGDKIMAGLSEDLIQGVVFGAKDVNPQKLREKLDGVNGVSRNATRLLDPQFYVSLLGSGTNLRLGNLEEYPYFRPYRRSQLEITERVGEVLEEAMEFQVGLPLSGIIAPNILITRSFDSAESVISKNFVRATGACYGKLKDKRPVYATLAVSREALLKKSQLQEFLADITLLDTPPDGFYLLVGASSSEARAEIFHADVIAGWLLLNYSLKVNGFEVINGYSDRLSPFLGAVGGDVGCSGWFNTLRTFSLDRFVPASTGGRLPVQRYLSNRLLNRVTFIELNGLRLFLPEILNGLAHDSDFPEDEEPQRNREVFQTWEALKSLIARLTNGDIGANLANCEAAIAQARDAYARISAARIPIEPKSGADHLEALSEGIKLFKELAEL
jgi:hypothetical protein